MVRKKSIIDDIILVIDNKDFSMKKLDSTRREYGQRALRKEQVSSDPFELFADWFKEVLNVVKLDPTAMVLATTDLQGNPDTRVVLLKEFNAQGFVFFSHYTSPKAQQVAHNTNVALNFYWHELSRQVRVKGHIEKVSRQESVTYFASRPRQSQICTVSSHQSEVIGSRTELEKHVQEIADQYQGKPIPCPESWGGFRVIPTEFEFFQGRDNRLNDRIRFLKINGHWQIDRLSP